MRSRTRWKTVMAAIAALACLGGSLFHPAEANAQTKKLKIYLSMSYSGNAYQTESANIIKALAATPPYNNLVDLKTVISGTNVEAQASAIESMVSAGANAIIAFPISSVGLNRAIRQACAKHVLFYAYSASVTEPCAHNVSFVTSGFAPNTAQWLVNQLHGKGNIFIDRGVPGNSVDKIDYDGAMSVFKKYPGIKVVAEYYGMWDDQTTQEETAKALTAHPDVDGIFGENGEDGIIKALLAAGKQKLIPVTGENTNGFRLALANAALRARGLNGVSSGDPADTGGFAFKLMMEQLLGKLKVVPHNVQYPLPWVTADQVKICSGDKFENGCNAFPSSKLPDSFNTEIFNPQLTPELSLNSALHGTPTPGAAIQPLPADAIVQAPDVPGINCQNCKAPGNLFKVTEVTPYGQS